MPYEVDSDILDSPNTKVLDINKPPMRVIPHLEFPRMVYLHPKDKQKEHRSLIVPDKKELEAAMKKGYKLQPHIPVPPPENEIISGEFEVA